MICGSYQMQDCTGRNGIVHHARRMTRCCNISSSGQMALESTTCGIVHHARRTRAHCPTMVSSYELDMKVALKPYNIIANFVPSLTDLVKKDELSDLIYQVP